MLVSDYLVDFLIKQKVTDVFGIPGGVVLEFINAIQRRTYKIKSHLSFHEQSSVFSACGYSLASKKLGVAYATRGPGITNTVTAVADAFCDSIPVLIITGHSNSAPKNGMRVFADQEIDTIKMFSGITKYCVRIDKAKDFQYQLEKACFNAMNGRKGPVLIDINTNILFEKIIIKKSIKFLNKKKSSSLINTCINQIKKQISKSKRPLFIIGDGFRSTNATKNFINISNRLKIPILSSRFSQDLFSKSKMHYGYFGSHGLRCGNFILSKSDLIISLGNRMIWPIKSKSFKKVTQKKIIRIDIDKNELKRKIPNSKNFNLNLTDVIKKLENTNISYSNANIWINACSKIKKELHHEDYGYPITAITEILKTISKESTLVSDVGNNEFWLCRAYAYSGVSNKVIYSKSFGAMGSAIGKAIGVYYGTRKPVICFIGDQSLQMNIQELQFLASNNIPITVILLNNFSSGMIRSREKLRYGRNFAHTTLETGYSVPNFSKVIEAYRVNFFSVDHSKYKNIKKIIKKDNKPKLLEIKINPEIELIPFIPKGIQFQEMYPLLDKDIFKKLDNI